MGGSLKFRRRGGATYFLTVADDEAALPHLGDAHAGGVQDKDLHDVAGGAEGVEDAAEVGLGVAHAEALDVLQDEDLRAQFLYGVAIYEDQVVQCLECLALGEDLLLAPRLLPLTGEAEGRAGRRAVQDVQLVEFVREVLPLVEDAEVFGVEVFRVVVALIDGAHLLVYLHAAQMVEPGELVAHR